MSLKLFRSTGFHSILTPGETRVAPHPAQAVALASGWVGIACNAWLWQALLERASLLPAAVAAGLALAGVAGAVLSFLGWRRTLKAAATAILLLAALVAGGIWTQDIAPQALVADGTRLGSFMPSWTSLFRWQVPTFLVVLGGVPVLWLWNTQLRRLTGSAQLRANLGGMFAWACVATAGFWLLARTPA